MTGGVPGRPSISVVIPTRDRVELLEASLKSLGSQSLPRETYEVVVVDDGSVDGTQAACESLAPSLPLRYQRIEHAGTSSAKNLGLFMSRAPIVLFFDDDDLAAPDLLEEHLAAHRAHPGEQTAILGHTSWAPFLYVSPLMEYVMDVGQLLFSYGSIEDNQELDFRFLWAGRTSVKRSLLAGNAVFNPDLDAVEDVELGFRLSAKGLKVVHWRKAHSYMSRRLETTEFCLRCQRQGVGRWLFGQLHDDPAVAAYCRTERAVEEWAVAAILLPSMLGRIADLEVTLEAEPCGPQASVHREELFGLYEHTFAAFEAKGKVEAMSSGARIGGTLLEALTEGSPGAAVPSTKAARRARVLAIYLPQFHPISENDRWWGPGFTEWTSVTRARPLFEGHYQPHLPTTLGFYDLRVPEAREAQARLARRHGIEGFCYWHYWFEGRRLLSRPFEEVLRSGAPDFPFCLAWANESWSRGWLGEDRDILIAQTYSRADDVRHARWLARAFSDRRYIRVAGRPLFLVYRPFDLPDPVFTTAAIRDECRRLGVEEPYLLGFDAHSPNRDCREAGFDATVAFEPQLGVLGVLGDVAADGLKVVDYVEGRQRMAAVRTSVVAYRSVFVGWDNTPRRGSHGLVFLDSTPEHFEEAMRDAVEAVCDRPLEDRLVFVNAWNEWAEGNHLEPERRHGLAFLEAVKRTVEGPGAGP